MRAVPGNRGRPKGRGVRTHERETPPGMNPAARDERNWRCSGFDGVGALAVLALGGRDGQAHLLARRSRTGSRGRECGCQPVAFISSLAVAPSGRFSRSRILAALLPSRAPVAFFALLGAFLAGVAFFPDLAFFGATLRARLAALAFGVAFGASAAGARAISIASAVEIIAFSPLLAGFPRSHESLWSET